jgi:hypothetical protein
MRYGLLNLFSISSILLLIAAAQSNAQTPQSDHRRSAGVQCNGKDCGDRYGTGVEWFGTSRAAVMREPGSFNTPRPDLGSPVQRVTVANAQETPVELTIDPSRMDRERRR